MRRGDIGNKGFNRLSVPRHPLLTLEHRKHFKRRLGKFHTTEATSLHQCSHMDQCQFNLNSVPSSPTPHPRPAWRAVLPDRPPLAALHAKHLTDRMAVHAVAAGLVMAEPAGKGLFRQTEKGGHAWKACMEVMHGGHAWGPDGLN